MPPGQGQNLKAAIAGQSGPINPNTPNERRDPRETELLNLNRIRRALERALEPLEGSAPSAASDVLHMMRGVISRMLAGIDPVQALMVGVQSLIPTPMPGGVSSGIAVPQVPAGPPPGGVTPPPMGMSPGFQGGGPVSPMPPIGQP